MLVIEQYDLKDLSQDLEVAGACVCDKEGKFQVLGWI